MSTGTKTEINKLVARCRRVGWDVTPEGAGYRVVNDVGAIKVIHGSYSISNAPEVVERELNKYLGLADREAELAARKATDKKSNLATQRDKADANAKRLARQAALTAKAAGPYAGPEVVPLDWFLQKHPAPWMRWVIIDPALAAELLKRNVDNRPMRQTTVDYYCRLISSGLWHLTHQGLAMDTRGVLQDGQHRLQACVDADSPIEVAFTVGLPVENFKAIDEGRNRSVADLLAKDDVGGARNVASAVRLVAAYREPSPRMFMRNKTPNEVLYDAFKGDPERLAASVHYGLRSYKQAGVVNTAMAAADYLLREANGVDNAYVEAFLNGLATGVKGDSRVLLDADDPRLILRKTLDTFRTRKRRTSAVDQLGYVIAAWNAIVQDRRLKWAIGEDAIPQIVVCRDRGRTASAAPDKLRGEFTS